MRAVRLFIGSELRDVLRKIRASRDENTDRKFWRLIELGFLSFELEEFRSQYEFVNARVKAMEEDLPLLEKDVPKLREALEQAAVDRQTMMDALDQKSRSLESHGNA